MKKLKIFQSKLDICVLLLILSTGIPLIANTYVSLSGTVQTILQYLYAYGIYLVFREITKRNKKFLKIVSNLLILVAVIMIIIGIDGITANYLTKILNIKQFANGENRLISVLGYPNTLATFLASVLFIVVYKMLKEQKKEIKAIYQTINLILIIGIILTYSKAIIVLLPISLLIYIVILKEKEKKVEIGQNIITAGMLSILFVVIFEKIVNTQNYLLMWLTFIIMVLTYYAINLRIKKIKIKKTIIALAILFISFITYIEIALNLYGEYPVFTAKIESDYEAKVIHNINGNAEYTLEFDIEAKAPKNIENTYTINLLERDDKNQELNQTNIKFGTFQGKKQIRIHTKETTAEIKIEFQSEYPYAEKKLIVKSLTINEKEVPLKYKYLPTQLVEKVQNISIHYKTVKERIEMVKNAIQLIKENPLTGLGGNAWQYKYQEVQSYPYVAKKLHSYPAKIMLEFGIIGIVAYLGIAISIIGILIKAIKNQDIKILSIAFAFLLFGIHSIIDIDMEYTSMLLYTFGVMGVLRTEIEEEKKTKIVTVSKCGIVIIAIIIVYLTINSKSFNKYYEIEELIRKRNGLANYSREYLTLNKQIAENYEEMIQYERYNLLENYKKVIAYTLESNCENKLEVIENYYEKILKDKADFKNKIKNIYDICRQLEEQNNPIYDEINEKMLDNIVNQKLEEDGLEEIYQKVRKMKNSYLLGIRIRNESEIQIDEKELEKLEIEETKEMLVYHTHGTESYQADSGYETYDFYKSLDESYNVIKVGNYLTELLNQKGILTIHNKEYHNYPNKLGTYAKSRKTVEEILNRNRNINKMIDIHRDAYSEEEHMAKTVKINEEEVAPIRLVIGINKEDENWMYDLKWAVTIQKKANEKYPGLMQPILIREETYNQDLSKYAILIEVGENCNKIEHALNSMRYFSEII